MNKFYITTAIPYVNAKPHVGHALEFVQADVIRRFRKSINNETLLLSGGDENAIKNVQAAEKEGVPIQEFVDKNSELFRLLAEKLDVCFDVFQKGSAKNHYQASQKLWNLCLEHGDIYKKEYSGLYCVGCELFYEPEELNEKGECYEHPGKPLEKVTEENYFFRLSKYTNEITKLIESDKFTIIPEERKNEALAFLKQGLKDISISRSNQRAKNWGVPVPNDSNQRMYVWFDALNIYQSGIGFVSDKKKYDKWWPANVHVIGKGILRFHAIYWPAFLLSAGLKIPKSLFVHGYFTVDNQKMSKTLGNVIDPLDMIEKYGVDALRYYFLREIPPTSDGDFSERRLKEIYNADLANGLGNLVARVAKLAEKSEMEFVETQILESVWEEQWAKALSRFDFNIALQRIWLDISVVDQHVNQNAPWKQTDKTKLRGILQEEIDNIRRIAFRLKPFLPQTAEIIEKQFAGPKIISQKSLFPRLS